ncbi:MAG: zinc ribbon domain-containing protein [Spirochaetia bacterium]|nr:zinc ribbon domain-containing protein [Spirochaetia bacterium]
MLIECSECGHQISDKATTCPNCGAPVSDGKYDKQQKVFVEETSKDIKIVNIIGAIIATIGMLIIIISLVSLDFYTVWFGFAVLFFGIIVGVVSGVKKWWHHG